MPGPPPYLLPEPEPSIERLVRADLDRAMGPTAARIDAEFLRLCEEAITPPAEALALAQRILADRYHRSAMPRGKR